MKGLDRAARQIAKLVGWALDETLELLWPIDDHARTYLSQVDGAEHLARAEEHIEVHEPARPHWWTEWEDEAKDGLVNLLHHKDPHAGAVEEPPVFSGSGVRSDIQAVLGVVLRSEHGDIAPLIAEAAAAELLRHFVIERRSR